MENFNWKIAKADRATPWGIISISAVLGIAIAAYLFYVGNYFGAGLLILVPVIFLIVSSQGQKDFSCSIEEDSIKANNSVYPFKKLSFFVIIADSLVLKPKDANAVYLPIDVKDAEKIREILLQQLEEEEEYEEGFSEIVNRLLRIY